MITLENVKKGGKSSNPKIAFMSVRLPIETHDFIKANNISLRKLIVAAVEELKKQKVTLRPDELFTLKGLMRELIDSLPKKATGRNWDMYPATYDKLNKAYYKSMED